MSIRSDNPNWAVSISQFVNIEQLNVELNDNVDDAFLNALCENCKKITFLNISGRYYKNKDEIKITVWAYNYFYYLLFTFYKIL